ncbi:MAG TPA: nuclear transport factor 2 family protein [Mycobacteriales bacterium]|nr:nuclear transport factor 2 family protein [Mycobacteriales bacterium]
MNPDDAVGEVHAVEALNGELYAAFETADIDRMGALWDDADDVVCVHPGWPLLRGRAHVLRSWSVIMANTTYIQFVLTDVTVSVDGDVAVVNCQENILTGLDADTGFGDSARVCATNVYRRRGNGWRLWVHHGSPVLEPRAPVADEPG